MADPLLIITNDDAGSSDQENLERALRLLRAATDVEVQSTGDPGQLDGVLHLAGSRTVVIAGGDGGLHAVLAAMHKRNQLRDNTVALLPLGTGNDFARSLEIPLDVEEAARVILTGAPRDMDLIVDEFGDIVANNVHVGAGAYAGRLGARWKERLGKVGVGAVNLGKLGYPIGALITAIKPPTLRLRVEVDGEVVADVDEPILQAAVGNGKSVGGGMELTPDADATDGKLDVMISTNTDRISQLRYALRLSRGEQREDEDVIYVRGRTVTMSGQEFYTNADGELSGPDRLRTWHLEPGAYRMIVPA